MGKRLKGRKDKKRVKSIKTGQKKGMEWKGTVGTSTKYHVMDGKGLMMFGLGV